MLWHCLSYFIQSTRTSHISRALEPAKLRALRFSLTLSVVSSVMEQEKYLPELMVEKDSLDPSFVHAMRLLAEGKRSTCGVITACISALMQ